MNEYFTNIRRNHALEHATVQIMLGKLGPTFHLAGRASSDGFFILGDVPPAELADCAHEALARLKRGESYWAITSLCGTNIAVTGILTSLATMAVTSSKQKGNSGRAMTMAMLAVVISQPLGRMLQRWVTTSADLEGTEIVEVKQIKSRFFKVKTTRKPVIAAADIVPAAVV